MAASKYLFKIAKAELNLTLGKLLFNIELKYEKDAYNYLTQLKEPAFLEQHQILLNFEGVTGEGTPPAIDVYINVPEGSSPAEKYFVGTLAFFGLATVTSKGESMFQSLDIGKALFNSHFDASKENLKITLALSHPPRGHIHLQRVTLLVL